MNNKASAQKIFAKSASKCSQWVGSPWAFGSALFIVIAWALSGPMFGFSDTWELVINTATTIITFLMVFLIQNTQNRDARAMHLKMDELIYCLKDADNKMLNIEELTPSELDELAGKYKELQEHFVTKSDEKRRHLHHKKVKSRV